MNNWVGFLGNAYPWVTAAHVTFVIFWMAGLFLLPRFYVYHHATAAGSVEDRAWIERNSRVRSIILTPAMLIVWALGLLLAFHIGAFGQHWFDAKLLLVIGLTVIRAGSAPMAASSLRASDRSRTGRCAS
jgi:putative membrane protein